MPTHYRKPLLALIGLLALKLVGPDKLSPADASAGQTPTFAASFAIAPVTATLLGPGPAAPATTVSAVSSRLTSTSITPEQLAPRDPRALTRLSRERYDSEIRAYTCVFLKQERIGDKLRDVEEIEVRYRESPKTVYMLWKRNADQAKRVLFIDSPEFVNSKGEKTARVEPAGALIRLIVSDIFMPIHGERARKTSRRFIDDFGFRTTLELLDQYNQLGAEAGVLDLRYEGEGEIDGRPTYKIVRYLPYAGPDGIWPDAKMVMHIDQKWLLPTAVYSYADRAGKTLLGSYVHTKVKLNPYLGDAAFKF